MRRDMGPEKGTLDALRIDRTQRGRSRSAAPLALVLLVILGGAGAAYFWTKRAPTVEVRTIAVRAVASGGAATLLNASGYVTARRQATVSSKVTGKVTEVSIEEGMTVEAGQVLARVDASNVETSLRLAEAGLDATRAALGETKANLEFAEREALRLRRLADQQAASPVEADRAETERNSLAARLERQLAEVVVREREVALWRQQLDDTVIRAPFSGVVTTKNAQPGEMISPMSVGGFTRTGICTIVDMTSLEIEVDVSESYINRVAPEQPVVVTLDSYPDWRIPARVIAIIPTADRQKATVKVRVGFEQLDPRILPDMSVKVAFQQAGADAAPRRELRIPRKAVRRDGGRDVVWIVREGKLERRAVTVSAESGEEVTIVAGLTEGERVVVQGPENLKEGDPAAEAKS
ncbi:MAG: efflux RND transporter periplasmic adaptor subunit [Phycisphaerae bacterium]|nr:efflux RND transporter periplasmic adaptor subunit [Phycisphaerae bacterium]